MPRGRSLILTKQILYLKLIYVVLWLNLLGAKVRGFYEMCNT